MDKDQLKKYIKTLCIDCDCKSDTDNCVLFEYILCANVNPRLLMQMKCVLAYKQNYPELTWDEVFIKWVDCGYAELFNNFYNEEITFSELYKKIIGE